MTAPIPPAGPRLEPCEWCGEIMEKNANWRRPTRHLECGIEKAIEVALQMKQRSGPFYDNWVESMRKVAGRLPAPTPPDATESHHL